MSKIDPITAAAQDLELLEGEVVHLLEDGTLGTGTDFGSTIPSGPDHGVVAHFHPSRGWFPAGPGGWGPEARQDFAAAEAAWAEAEASA